MMFKMVWGSFWPKLVKSRGFKPNGHHEWFRSVKKIQNQPVKCQKGLTGTPFMTDQGVGEVWAGLGGRFIILTRHPLGIINQPMPGKFATSGGGVY